MHRWIAFFQGLSSGIYNSPVGNKKLLPLTSLNQNKTFVYIYVAYISDAGRRSENGSGVEGRNQENIIMSLLKKKIGAVRNELVQI